LASYDHSQRGRGTTDRRDPRGTAPVFHSPAGNVGRLLEIDRAGVAVICARSWLKALNEDYQPSNNIHAVYGCLGAVSREADFGH